MCIMLFPPPITGNPLTPRADISFARLDEYAFRNKIIESKTTETNKTVGTTNTVVSKSKINRDEVIIEDWTSDDEDDVCANKTVSSVKPNVIQTVRSQADKSGQTSQKQGIGFKKRSYFTQPVYRPKDLKPDVKTFGVKNMTTVGTRAVVSKGKVENVLKKDTWVWRLETDIQEKEQKERQKQTNPSTGWKGQSQKSSQLKKLQLEGLKLPNLKLYKKKIPS
ncbi:hypothetical protein Tco_1544862 [Tanacetum coccineum]